MATASYDSRHPGTSLKPLLVGTGMGALKLAGGACSASASLRAGGYVLGENQHRGTLPHASCSSWRSLSTHPRTRVLPYSLGCVPAHAAARGEVELEGAGARRDRGGDRVEVGRAEVPRQGRGEAAQPEDPLVRVKGER